MCVWEGGGWGGGGYSYPVYIWLQDYGTFKVSGYVRGRALTVNSLVHIPGLGDFQMAQVRW